jgi:hypothetical protein
MNTGSNSEFEQRLRRQPLKPLPGEWRAEILSAVAADVNRRQNNRQEPTATATGWSWLSNLLWPHPKAWAGLAAVWIFIFALNFSMREKAPVIAGKSAPPSPETVAELRQQQKMLAELIGPAEWRVADRQRVLSPQPRSARADILAA